jgi:hypothetical protein
MKAVCRQYAGSMQAVCRQYAGSMQAGRWSRGDRSDRSDRIDRIAFRETQGPWSFATVIDLIDLIALGPLLQ